MSSSAAGLYQESIQLPSRGLFYPPSDCPGGEVVIRALTTGDESLMQNVSKDNIDTRMNKMIAGCIISGWNNHIGRMAVADRMFLLYRLRILTHGGEYAFESECPKCEEVSSYRIDLDKLPVEMVKDGVVEPLFVTLPICKKRIGWRFLRVDDETEASVYKRQHKQRGAGGDPSLTFQYARRIVSLDGEDDIPFEALFKFSKEMHSRDRRLWEKNIEEHSVGIETELELTCRECGKHRVTSMPMDDDFFRPSLANERELSAIFAAGVDVAYNPDEAFVGSSDVNADSDAGATGAGLHEGDGRSAGDTRGDEPGTPAAAVGNASTNGESGERASEEDAGGKGNPVSQAPGSDGKNVVFET